MKYEKKLQPVFWLGIINLQDSSGKSGGKRLKGSLCDPGSEAAFFNSVRGSVFSE